MSRSKSTKSGSTKVESLLKQIGKVSASLNKAADDAMKYIEAAESKLLKAGVGITVWDGAILQEDTTWFQDGMEEEESAVHVIWLGFAKVGTMWGIAIKDVIDTSKDPQASVIVNESISLLRQADREKRILAVPHIPDLLEAILEELEEKKKEVGEANTALKDLGITMEK